MKEILACVWLATQWMGVGLEMAILAGLSAAIFGLAVWVVDRLLRRWITPSQMAFLWLLVLIRLLLPFGPESAFSLKGLTQISLFPLHYPDGEATPVSLDPVPPLPQADAVPFPGPIPQASGIPEITREEPLGGYPFEWNDLWIGLLIWTWVGVGGVGFVWAVRSYLMFCRKVAGQRPLTQGSLWELWKGCCEKVGIRRDIPLVKVDNLSQPAIQGALHPKLLWPADLEDLTESQARMVMFHELAHVKRWDIVFNWTMLILRAVQWWNPVYWIAGSRFQQLREQACDAFAMRAMGDTPARDYGELLLSLSQVYPASGWKAPLPVSVLGFFTSYFRKQSLGQRLRALSLGRNRQGRIQKILVAILVLAIGWAGLTDARSPRREMESYPDLNFPTSAFEVKLGPIASEEAEMETEATHEYPLGNLVGNGSLTGKTSFERKREIEAILRDLLGFPQQKFHVDVQGDRLFLTVKPRLHGVWRRAQLAWEKHGMTQVVIETRIITSRKDLLSSTGVSWEKVVFGAAGDQPSGQIGEQTGNEVSGQSSVVETFPLGLTTLQEIDAEKIVHAACKDPAASVCQAPKVTQFQSVPVSISVCDKGHFLMGYQMNHEGKMIPAVKEIDLGMRMKLFATTREKGAPIHFAAKVLMNDVDGPIDLARARVGAETNFIQLPRFKLKTIDVSRELSSGQTLLVGCFPTLSAKNYHYFLFTVRRLDEVRDSQP